MPLARSHGWVATLVITTLSACAAEVGDEPNEDSVLESVDEALTNPAAQHAVWMDNAAPALHTDYFPPSSFRLNVTKVRRTNIGMYDVYLTQPEDFDFPMAVAFGTDNRRCAVYHMDDNVITVRCTTPHGAAANSRFVLNNFRLNGSQQGRAAGGWVGVGGDRLLGFNTVGSFSSTRNDEGNYTVFLTGGLGLAGRGGNVQVSAFLDFHGAHCKVASWLPDPVVPSVLAINVLCFAAGSDTKEDTPFVLLFDEEILTQTNRGAYTFANNATSGLYTPPAHYTFSRGPGMGGTSTTAAGILVATGHHKIVYQGPNETTASKSYAFAVAYGSSSDYCKIIDWDIVEGCAANCDIEVHTACFDKGGVAKSSKFVQTWGSWRALGPD
jgi:hypothetical protein